MSTESESSTSKASANANKAAAKQGKSEAMSRSATSGDCSARRPGGPVRRKSTTASDDREFIDTDEETNKLLDTARTVTEYHDEETDEDKARRNGQDKSAVAAKSSNPSTSSQDNDRNVTLIFLPSILHSFTLIILTLNLLCFRSIDSRKVKKVSRIFFQILIDILINY